MLTKVKSVKPSGKEPYQSANGLLYSFIYDLEDGVKLTVNHKTEAPRFKSGDTVEYSITSTNKFGSLGKMDKPKLDGSTAQPIQPNNGFGSEESQLDRVERKIDQILATANKNNEAPF